MKQLGTWIFTALFFTAVGGWCGWMLTRSGESEEPTHEVATQPAEAEPQPVSHDEAGNVVVHFDRETQQRLAMRVQPISSAEHCPELCALGVLQEDPLHEFTIRAPLAGKIVAPANGDWPQLGTDLAENTVVGGLEPRLTPIEKADLAARLADAQGNVEEVRAELAASRSALEAKKQLNVGQKLVSDQVLHDAEAAVRGQEARLEAALATVKILTSSLDAATQSAAAIPLVTPIRGRVVDAPAGPDESVESGQPLLRVANYDHMIARIALPAGSTLDEQVRTARIAISGHEDRWFDGQRLALAPAADGITGGPTWLFALAPEKFPVQPGLPVIAYLPITGDPLQGTIIPRSAVIRYLGGMWVYVRTGEEAFTRREMVDSLPLAEGLFVARGFKPGDEVVITGAQSLLSEELRYQTTGTEEEEE